MVDEGEAPGADCCGGPDVDWHAEAGMPDAAAAASEFMLRPMAVAAEQAWSGGG